MQLIDFDPYLFLIKFVTVKRKHWQPMYLKVLKMLFSQIGPFSRYHILYYGGQADIDLHIYADAQNQYFLV